MESSVGTDVASPGDQESITSSFHGEIEEEDNHQHRRTGFVMAPSNDGNVDIQPQPKTTITLARPPSFNPVGSFPVPDYPDAFERIDEGLRRVELYKAVIKGDWESAKGIFLKYPKTVTMHLNNRDEIALHLAARAMNVDFVKQLVELMTKMDLMLRNVYGNTALCISAASGVVDIAKSMLDKNPLLTEIRGAGNATPLLIAAKYKRKDMLFYLLDNTSFSNLPLEDQMEILVNAISANYYDVALRLIQVENPNLTTVRNINGDTAMHIIARKSSSIIGSSSIFNNRGMPIEALVLVQFMWSAILYEYSDDNALLEFIGYPSSMLHDAARVGNVEFLRLLLQSYPDLLWALDDSKKSIFHIAVENRQESVFRIIYEIGEFLDYLSDFEQENVSLLELAAKKAAPNHLSQFRGAAFQMHRELLWFKEVEKIEELTTRKKKWNEMLRELFTDEHKNLVEEGGKWVKETASSCMLVATLIATVVFAAALTVPGGNNDNGFPVFIQNKWFTVFVISNTSALIFSSTSILLFLSILTSHCGEDDFLISLPLKLVFGLTTLFLSVVTMVLAFTATFFLLYKVTTWVPWFVVGMAVLPISFFVLLQLRLLADALAAVQTTWRAYFFIKKKKVRVHSDPWFSII